MLIRGKWQDLYHTWWTVSITGLSLSADLLLVVSLPHPGVLLVLLRHPVPEHPALLLLTSVAGSVGVDVVGVPVRRVGGCPVLLQPAAEVVTGLLEVVFMEDDVPHL